MNGHSRPVLEPLPRPLARVAGGGVFPVTRIFCVGRNYAEHAAEMNSPAEPIFFMKPAEAIEVDLAAVPIPADTDRFDHEVELVLALGAGGRPRTEAEALALVWGAGVGVDLTRRDVQAKAKTAGGPWEAAKAFDGGAPLGPLVKIADARTLEAGAITLAVNGEPRQRGDLGDQILKPGALLLALAKLWTLKPGDLVFTGTPAGVGPLKPGDHVTCSIAGVGELAMTMSGS